MNEREKMISELINFGNKLAEANKEKYKDINALVQLVIELTTASSLECDALNDRLTFLSKECHKIVKDNEELNERLEKAVNLGFKI